jgi:hypothetical protein
MTKILIFLHFKFGAELHENKVPLPEYFGMDDMASS